MQNLHTLKSFDEAILAITQRFEGMGNLAVDNCAKAIDAYLRADSALALEVVGRDLDLDETFEKIRADCFDVLLRFQPVATDLRMVMGIEHAVGDLERAGDYAKNIAKRVISNPAPPITDAEALRLSECGNMVVGSLRKSINAMIGKKPEDAREVIAADRRIDARNEAIFDAVMVKLKTTAANAPGLVQQLFVSKALERIGDHATNIAEEVLFLTRGISPGATRTDSGTG